MEFSFNFLCLLCLYHLLINCDFCATAGNSKRQFSTDKFDQIFIAQCTAKCWSLRPSNQKCVKACLAAPISKLGECPAQAIMSVFETPCLDLCHTDSQCPNVQKCCRHSCGITCQMPRNLSHFFHDLPPVPTNIAIMERRRSRGIIIKWKGVETTLRNDDPIVLYVVEERHHAGQHFSENRLGPWTPLTSSRSSGSQRQHRPIAKTALHLRNNQIKPGRWYQFRVAAVNINGTRGYSTPSKHFTTQHGPRPPGIPENLTVGPLWTNPNGTLWAELRWTAPSMSDLPVEKFKVFWSRRLQGSGSVLDSVLVNHQIVPKEQQTFILQDLQPGFQYFLQVQALTQHGRTRLKGEKAGIILNTTNYSMEITSPNHKSSQDRVEDLSLHRMFWHRKRLFAKISWKPPPSQRNNGQKFTVTWWINSCSNSDKSDSMHLLRAATTETTRFDLYDLKFSCKYRVSVQTIRLDGTLAFDETFINFGVPSCEHFVASNKLNSKDRPQCN